MYLSPYIPALETERFFPHKRNAIKPPFFTALARKPLPAYPGVLSTFISLCPYLLPSINMVKNDANLSPTKRPSIRLKISCGSSNISNSEVVSASGQSFGQSLYSISSNSKCTTLVSCKNNVKIATVNWDRSSPCMVFRRKKIKCKDWLPLARPDTEYVPCLRCCYSLLSF